MKRAYPFPETYPFDYQLAMDRLREYRAPRDHLRLMCERGEVIRVKKGLYIPGRLGGGAIDPFVLSGLVYGPSYVSLESALSWHGLIPERVQEITCMTTKRARTFDTPAGRFSYQPIRASAFALGISRKESAGGAFLIAGPEKALCDRIAQIRGLRAIRDVRELLRDDLRIDVQLILKFDLPLVMEIAKQYGKDNVTAFAKWLEKIIRKKKRRMS